MKSDRFEHTKKKEKLLLKAWQKVKREEKKPRGDKLLAFLKFMYVSPLPPPPLYALLSIFEDGRVRTWRVLAQVTMFYSHDLFMWYSVGLRIDHTHPHAHINTIFNLTNHWLVSNQSFKYKPFRRCRPVLCNWLSKKYPSIELKSVNK